MHSGNSIEESNLQNKLLESILVMQNDFIKRGIYYGWCKDTLENLLFLSESEFGFICELLHKDDGTPYIKSHGVTNIAWDEQTSRFYEEKKEDGLEFFNFESLWGKAITTGEPVIANDPDSDDRRGGYPKDHGHPQLASFLGLPIKDSKGKVVGVMGVANRPDGYDQEMVDFLRPFLNSYGMLIEKYRSDLQKKKLEVENEKLIADLKHNQNALKKSKTLLDATGRIARVGGWELNANTLEVTWTEETYRIHEIPLGSEPPLKDAIKFYHSEDRPKLERAVQRALHHGEPYDMEFRLITAKGNHLWTRSTCQPQIKNGKVEKLFGTFQDITDRKSTEIALKKSEEQLQLVIKGSNDAPWDWDLISNELYYSPQWWSQLGYTPDELPSDAALWERLIHPEDSEHVNSVFGGALQNVTDSYEVEFRLLHKDGHYVPVLSRGFITRDETGKAIRVTGTNMDLTEQKHAEQVLAKSLRRYDDLVSRVPVGVYVFWIRADGRMEFEYVSDRFCTIFKLDREDVIADYKLAFDRVHPDDREEHLALNQKAFRDRKPLNFEGRFIIGGELRWLQIESTPEVLANGDTRWFGISKDITVRKQAEDSLRKSHERFLTVLNSIEATIYVADMESYEVLFMNRNMINIFGSDMTGEVCWKAFRGESGPCSYCPNEKLIDENGKPAGVYTRQEQNPITGRWYINYDSAIEWTDGRLVKLHVANDITKMKQLEDQLRQAQKMESIGTLAGGIAHEFNNMLSIILGNSELAFDDIPDWSPAKDCLKEIKQTSLHARNVVQKLLSVARKTPESRKPIRIRSIIEESLNLLRSTIPTTIDVRTHITCSTEMILGDPTEINQVLINLCTNSIHAMTKESGVLEVGLDTLQLKKESAIHYEDLEPGDYVSLTVKDTGEGIELDYIDRLFDPYFTTKDVDQGLGMGLAVVHGIVKKHDGVIRVESETGKGTTFEVLFPLTEETVVESKTEDIETPQKGTERVLFVDDEKMLAGMIMKMLERSGYEVVCTTSSLEALRLFKEDPYGFDLVISDMTMPEMAGDQLVKEIIQIRPDMKIILCTGHSNLMDERKAKALGINAFAMKPISMKALTKTVREVLDGSMS